jgi:hypothetical protein
MPSWKEENNAVALQLEQLAQRTHGSNIYKSAVHLMIGKKIWVTLFFLGGLFFAANAQRSAINVDSLRKIYFLTDSLDSAQLVAVPLIDTLTPKGLKPLDSVAKTKITDSVYQRRFGYEETDFKLLTALFLQHTISQDPHQKGDLLPKGEVWVLVFIAIWLIAFAILKQNFSKQLLTMVQAFFSNRILSNLNKEDHLFNSWAFLLLIVQFGFTTGLFLYFVAQYQNVNYTKNGFQFFLVISVLVIVLYALKIVLLKLVGFIFNIQKPIAEYISILYLSYFNTSLLFVPLAIAFALSPLKYASLYVAIAIILVTLIFAFQFIRAGINILSNYRFSKVYLFLYFCTLEFCPILILIKAIDRF